MVATRQLTRLPPNLDAIALSEGPKSLRNDRGCATTAGRATTRRTVGLQENAVLGSSLRRLMDYTSANRVDKYFLVYPVCALATATWVWYLLTAPQSMAGMLDMFGVHRFTISAIQRFGFVPLHLPTT